MSHDDDDNNLDNAIRIMRAWHYTAVRRIVDYAIEACVGRVVCSDPEVEAIARDAEKEGRDREAESIRASNPVKRTGQERDSDQDPEEFLQEYIDETTDSHQHVTYTMQAKCVLLASDNEDAYQDEMGEAAPTIEAAACMAMRRDCWEILHAREDEWKPRDCEDCCITLDVSIVDSVSDEHDDSCHLHPEPRIVVCDAGRTDVIAATGEADA